MQLRRGLGIPGLPWERGLEAKAEEHQGGTVGNGRGALGNATGGTWAPNADASPLGRLIPIYPRELQGRSQG